MASSTSSTMVGAEYKEREMGLTCCCICRDVVVAVEIDLSTGLRESSNSYFLSHVSRIIQVESHLIGCTSFEAQHVFMCFRTHSELIFAGFQRARCPCFKLVRCRLGERSLALIRQTGSFIISILALQTINDLLISISYTTPIPHLHDTFEA